MKVMKLAFVLVLAVSLAAMAGCGVSKSKYDALLNEKITLDEKVNVITKSRDALKNEYDNLLKDKMDLATKFETLGNEKNALKGEYDKLLEEKVSLKAAYDKLVAESEELKVKAGGR
jgi:chromosome segregation ATPase